MPLPALIAPLVLGLAPKLATMVMGDVAGNVTEKVVGAFSDILDVDVNTAEGIKTAQEQMAGDPDIAEKMRMRLEEIESEEFAAILQDRDSARDRDVEVRRMNDGENARAKWMLLGAFAILVSSIGGSVALAIYGDMDAAGIAAAFGLLSAMAGQSMGMVKEAFSFEFGSSRGSKNKDNSISAFTSGLAKLTDGLKADRQEQSGGGLKSLR